jgi:hypothetical protein
MTVEDEETEDKFDDGESDEDDGKRIKRGE